MLKLTSGYLAVIIITFFLIGIGGTIVFNLWQTESSKVPRRISEGEFSGQADPGDIRGSYSFNDILTAFGVPVEDMAEAFGVEEMDDPGGFLCKELENLYTGIDETREIGTDSVRLFVAAYLGIPYTPEESTALPASAFPILRRKANLTETALEALQDHKISGNNEAPVISYNENPQNTEANTIKGSTTFLDLTNWGLSEADIQGILGIPSGPPGTTIRDYLLKEGIEFSGAKTALQELVDSQ